MRCASWRRASRPSTSRCHRTSSKSLAGGGGGALPLPPSQIRPRRATQLLLPDRGLALLSPAYVFLEMAPVAHSFRLPQSLLPHRASHLPPCRPPTPCQCTYPKLAIPRVPHTTIGRISQGTRLCHRLPYREQWQPHRCRHRRAHRTWCQPLPAHVRWQQARGLATWRRSSSLASTPPTYYVIFSLFLAFPSGDDEC